LMADFILSAGTMNFDGLRSSWVRKLTMFHKTKSREYSSYEGGKTSVPAF
jgi:hypothetical protein